MCVIAAAIEGVIVAVFAVNPVAQLTAKAVAFCVFTSAFAHERKPK